MTQARIDHFLARAQARIKPRVEPSQLLTLATDALVVDIRPLEQRQRDGELPGAVVIQRNVLEWRLDPTSPHRIAASRRGRQVILVCNEGYQSSLAAAVLRDLSVNATDLIGGFQAWRQLQQIPSRESPVA